MLERHYVSLHPPMMLKYLVRPYVLPAILFVICLALVAAHIASKGMVDSYPSSRGLQMVMDEFDLNSEGNFPAWFSSYLWILSAFKCVSLAKVDLRSSGIFSHKINWMMMAGISLFLSLDETTAIHERIGELIERRIGTDMPFYAWAFYGLAFSSVVTVLLLPFLWKLPRHFFVTVVLGGTVFLMGALGVENLGAMVDKGYLTDFPVHLTWTGAIALEEGLEMFGVIIFYAALCELWQRNLQHST